jgi:hypothetical protein
MSNSSRRYGLFDFSDYMAKRVADFTGRTWVFQEIDRWLGQPDAARYFLLTGEPGSGKSAVAARLAQFSAGEVVAPPACRHLTPGFLRAVHFCSTTASDWVDPRSFARSIGLQLAGIQEYARALKDVGDRNINIDVRIQAGTVQPGGSVTGLVIQNLVIQGLNVQEAFNRAVLDPLRAIYETGYDQPILVLVDSLDEALTSSTEVKIVDLLAGVEGMDSRVRFILTSRLEPRVESRFPSAGRLSLSDPAHQDDNDRDIAAFVTLRLENDPALAGRAAALPPAQAATLPAAISARADGNFQYVAFLLKAAATGQQSLASPAGLPPGLDSLYHESLRRVVTLGRKDWATVYQPFLGVLSVALEPLTLEVLKTYTASATSLWNVYMDLIQFVEDVPVSPLISEEAHPEDRYRLYHQSVIDFLHKQQLLMAGNGQVTTQPNLYYLDPGDWHARIVASCAGPAGDWSQVDWSAAAHYTLRHLVAHLYQLRQANGYRNKLHALLETRPFVDQHLAILGKPYLLLDDLRLALSLALEADDLAQAWRHIREYRRIARDQLDFDRLLAAVETGNQTGDYVHVTERTALYGTMPNSQALARLWIAWNAAASGHPNAAGEIVKRALDRLPPRGSAHIASQRAGGSARQAVEDAIGETLQRLLMRIAQAAQTTLDAQSEWLREAMSPWPASTVDETVGRLSEALAAWGELVDAGQTSDTMQSLFQELQARGGRLDADAPPTLDKYTIYSFQKRLAAGLFNSRHDPSWLEHVKRCVALIALDDYPSYREMALCWVAAAALAQEDPTLAQKALAAVLGGMFRPSPGFWGDTVAAALDGMAWQNNQGPDAAYLLSLLEHVEATGERGVDPSVARKMPEIIQWRRQVGLPEDPWSFRMRRRSAVAAILHRRGDQPGAEALLQEASAAPYEGSYAGFRALVRLSLACRWLEWRRIDEAIRQTSLAETDASHVRDEVLRQERLDLVNKMRDWITTYGSNPATLLEEEALAQLQQKSGLERGLFIEFVSALWFDAPARLKRLLPLGLDDATTADAVLGRWLGVEALNDRPGAPFLQLVKALHVDTGVENE